MEYLNLLILEDNDTDFSNIHLNNIEAFNKIDKKINFRYPENRVRTVEDAQNLLSSDSTFHSAIIDLKLAQEPADSGKGNKLVELIIEKYRIPIFVYSNNTGLLDPKFEEYKGYFLTSYLKGQKNFLEILNEIKGINETGIIEILSRRGHIENILDKVFWKHISTSLGNWIKINQSKKEKEKMLLRHVSEYISQYLGINEDTGTFEMYNKAEFYTVPPIKGQLFTGDILYRNSTEEYFIVLTPACDLAQDKAKKILLANIIR